MVRITFNKTYFLLAMLLLVVEILIAMFAHDHIIRPYAGDLLVVILIYCFVKSFLNLPYMATALSVLLFSFAVETLQYFHLVNMLGLQHSNLARIIIGTHFEWIDLAAYIIGIIIVIFCERTRTDKKSLSTK